MPRALAFGDFTTVGLNGAEIADEVASGQILGASSLRLRSGGLGSAAELRFLITPNLPDIDPGITIGRVRCIYSPGYTGFGGSPGWFAIGGMIAGLDIDDVGYWFLLDPSGPLIRLIKTSVAHPRIFETGPNTIASASPGFSGGAEVLGYGYLLEFRWKRDPVTGFVLLWAGADPTPRTSFPVDSGTGYSGLVTIIDAHTDSVAPLATAATCGIAMPYGDGAGNNNFCLVDKVEVWNV